MRMGLGLGFGGQRVGTGGGVGGTAPTITGTPLLTDNAIDVTGTLPMTFHYTNTASATPPSASTIKAAPDSRSLVSGANSLTGLTQETTPGTWYFHYLVSNAAGDSAIETESYVVAASARPQYVGGKAWQRTTSLSTASLSLTDLTGGLASAPAEGDLVIVAFTFATEDGVDRDVQVTSGYTEVADLFREQVWEVQLGVFYKRMTATPDTTVTIGQTYDANYYAGAVAIHVWRGVDAVTPMDVTPVTATGGTDANPDPAAITPITTDAVVIVAGGGSAQTASTTAYSSSDLSNFVTACSSNLMDSTVGMGSFDWTSGAFNPAAWTGAQVNGNNAWAAVTIALRPA